MFTTSSISELDELDSDELCLIHLFKLPLA